MSVMQRNFGCDDTVLDWIISYLRGRQLQVQVKDTTSSTRTFNYSVPQGSCLGPVLFNMYMSTIAHCIESGQDISKTVLSQLHCIQKISVQRIEKSIGNIINWMSANYLKINPEKTEITLFGSHQLLSKVQTRHLSIGQEQVSVSDTIKYLGVYLDSGLSLQDHIMAKCRTAICDICKIKQIRIFIDTKTATTLTSSLVLSHLDYSNSVLCGLPDNTIRKLQRVQHWAAKVVLYLSKYDSSSGALLALYWLPIRQRKI